MTINPQVVEFLNKLEHPLKKEIEVVRNIIQSANQQLTEHIKWNAPSFCMNNEDRITFNLHGDKFIRLIFHCGSKVKVNQSQNRLFDDTTGLLDWASTDRAIVKFTDMNDVEAKREKLLEIVIKWIEVSC
ncbi:DUF1801 domain-containing protein [Paenibacillus psychroresistens]|uniref:DUF1801 domain-containing protein n=1 Tax=Paenibacillus psychroresistens TaxID=1778678 RepID=A0A6B8RI38_9BACL|nr:DUF1801 domain-containing protein [Paenibacillus psychroresistens]QGQ95046.1 DUF1801 domain-containing protein [Paenibacillus psychroresistens]